jgi:hypothetical protein
MVRSGIVEMALLLFVTFSCNLNAQNIYDLRKLTEQQWLAMPTDQRMRSIGIAMEQTDNQTFVGQFGRYQERYKKWGYEFYEMNDQYENLSFRGWENYNVINERRVRWSFNEFGDRIVKMRLGSPTPIYLWREIYNDDGTYTIDYANKTSQYINAISSPLPIDGVWVAREGTNDWTMSLVSAGAIRAKYTPLTFSIPNNDGTRIDIQSANNIFSVLSSVPIGDTSELSTAGGALIRAGRFQRKLGILTLGATYANAYSVQGNRQDGNSWYGTVSNYTPTPLEVAVRVLDDSPDDGNGGPQVSDVRLKINGHYRDDIRPVTILDDVTRELTSAIVYDTEATYIKPDTSIKIGGPSFDFLSLNERIPKYIDYFYLENINSGVNRVNTEKNFSQHLAQQYYQMIDPRLPIQVNGTQYIVYLFDISIIKEPVQEVTAELTVCNDFLIQTATIYTKVPSGGHDPAASYSTWYTSTYWKTALESPGNIRDKSNLQRVSVDFGIQVASITYGVDANLNYLGLKISGEYAANSNHYMFPDDYPGTGFPNDVIAGQPARQGHRWAEIDHAYYITVQKDWDRFGLAGEYFKMGNFYKPYLDYFYPKATEKGYGAGSVNARNNIVRIPLVEDNDDNDQYPDTMYRQMGMGYDVESTEDPDGVFPGNDIDHDGIPDNNKNLNYVPDYTEPFLMFDSDPDEFVFGNDYNNNTFPDFREDDMKLDTPYDLDRQGRHVYLRYTPMQSINFITGSMRTHGVGTDNRTNNDYFKFQVNYDVFDIGKLYAEYRHERIQDNIRDAYVNVNNQPINYGNLPGHGNTPQRFTRDIFYDELEYKNSSVDRLWIDSALRALPAVTIENHLKIERNSQFEGLLYDNTYQPWQDIHTLAMVNKVTFAKGFGDWMVSPGVKFRFYKKDRGRVVRFGDYYLERIPVLMIKYIISPRTDLTLGMQGVPRLEYTYTDYIEKENNYMQKTYALQLQNRTVYFGYNIWAAAGIRFDEMKFEEALREFENYKTSTLFVNFLLGY